MQVVYKQPLRNKSDIDEMYNHRRQSAKGCYPATALPITYNKIYDTISGAGNPLGLYIDKSEYSYLVKCDDDNHRWIPVKYFITIDEHRDKIINQIIDESSI